MGHHLLQAKLEALHQTILVLQLSLISKTVRGGRVIRGGRGSRGGRGGRRNASSNVRSLNFYFLF